MKMEKKKIYIPLQGRIGNQLFQYAFARKIQMEMGEGTGIVMDDSDILQCGWENFLPFYHLPNVEYLHDSIIKSHYKFSKQSFLRKMYRVLTKGKDYMHKFEKEKKLQPMLNRNGMFLCENGYMEPYLNYDEPIYLEGYFQSEKYFKSIKDDIFKLLDGSQFQQLALYPGLEKLKNKNSVCISIKVEHNVGNSMYGVCSVEYWKKAISYIVENVDDPFFFICSDNVPYVIENLIDVNKFDYMVQAQDMPVHISLAAMAECRHFIISNTTFGWWAQYLSKNENKIVVAPSRWMAVEMPIDIYQEGWRLIEV